MFWLKAGRWLVGAGFGLSLAAACGGRGNLPTGEVSGGDSGVGGSISMAGTTIVGGTSAVAGASTTGGSVGVAGTSSSAGSAAVCLPGVAECRGNAVAQCDATGRISVVAPCAKSQICIESFPNAFCQAQTVCRPNQRFCDKLGVRQCGPDGSTSVPVENCVAGQFCDPQALTCKTDVCMPNLQACNGNVATTCNASGSGYVAGGVDCGLLPNRQCVLGACSCGPSFGDCDGFPQNGCETKVATDPDNCAACGQICSKNHMATRTCNAVCDGACQMGFADCNGNKQTDGCEVDTSNDPKNCGGCGKACPVGQSCASGKCGSLLTFTGVAQDLPLASLAGWKQCLVEAYGQNSTTVANVQKVCAGSLLMMACRPKGSDTLQLAAYAPTKDVLFDTGLGNTPHNANGVGWYFNASESWGFAPQGDVISRNSCDVENSALSFGGVDGDKRLCWHTTGGVLQGGWRCGKNDGLNISTTYERVLFTSP